MIEEGKFYKFLTRFSVVFGIFVCPIIIWHYNVSPIKLIDTHSFIIPVFKIIAAFVIFTNFIYSRKLGK